MMTLSPFFESAAAQALAWALVHFLWQGAVIAALAAVLLRMTGASALGRYRIGLTALALLAAAPAVTFSVLISTPTPPTPLADPARVGAPAAQTVIGSPISSADSTVAAPGTGQSAQERLSAPAVILPVWLAGVALLTLRLGGGWWVARRLVKQSSTPASSDLKWMATRVAARLELSRAVSFLESAVVTVPVTVGWLKPVVLFPVSALAGLSPVQLEALLAHELAHVRRHDYVVNLLQSGVEVVLFYHPAVWWISRLVRTEREHCCDDLAVGVSDRLAYATALSTIATMATPRVALAATDGPLLARIRRILGTPDAGASRPAAWVPLLLLLIALAVALPAVLVTARTAGPNADDAMAGDEQSSEPTAPPQAPGVAPVAAPAQSESRERDNRLRETTAFLEQQAERARAVLREQEQVELQRAEEARRLVREAESRIAAAQAEELRIEHERASTAARLKLQSYESDLAVMTKHLEALKRRVAIGLAKPEEVADAELQVVQLQLKFVAARSELNLSQQAYEARRMSIEAMRDHERVQREYATSLDRASRNEQVLRESVMREMASRERALLESTPVQEATAQVRAGDVLVVTIQNEPDLPRSFVVSSDNTIRFPLVGAIRVGGMSLGDARAAITRALTDRRLAANSKIDVGLRRRQ